MRVYNHWTPSIGQPAFKGEFCSKGCNTGMSSVVSSRNCKGDFCPKGCNSGMSSVVFGDDPRLGIMVSEGGVRETTSCH